MSTEETRVSRFSDPSATSAEAACLVVIHAPVRRLLGARLPLAREVVLGRDPACDLVLDAEDVSRRHARLRHQGDGHVLEDLGSTNGTFLADVKVATACPVRPGDLIRVGSVVLKYLAGGDLEALYHAEVKRLADEDPLTGLVHKGGFAEALRREVARARRHGSPLCLALLDIDHFKRVNDCHGHLAGDHVLRELAASVRPLVRAEQVFARIGGEELALLLPGVALDQAVVFADKVRALVADREFLFDGARIPLTVSLGVAELLRDDAAPDALVRHADARLYDAKGSGRNKVCA